MVLSIKEQIIAQLDRLTPEQQQRVLDYTQAITRPPGETGQNFLDATRDIHISTADLDTMKAAIEEACERIDWDEWDLSA